MNEFNLALPGHIHINLCTPHVIDNDVALKLGAHLPGIRINPTPYETPTVTVHHSFDTTPFFKADEKNVIFRTEEQSHFPDDLYHLLYGVARKEFLSQSLYPAHAACVGVDEHYTLLVGHSGSGKTSLATTLVREDGFTLFSGNKTLVALEADRIKAVAGTHTITALDDKQKRYAFELEEGQYTAVSQVPIRSIHIIRLNDGVEESGQLSPLSALHTLYPYFLDSVNADVIVNGQNLFDGNIADVLKQTLAVDLKQMLHHIPVYTLSGSMQHLKKGMRL